MHIILLRHVESEKNIRKTFSSRSNQERLTTFGTEQSVHLAKCIAEYGTRNMLKIKHVYAANSERARLTASAIATQCASDILCENSFLSVTTDESLKGKTEKEISAINPQFIEELNLYRCGLFNAYRYSTVADVIKSGEYEKKVISTFNRLLDDNTETLKVFVMHHSSITATLIYIARSMGIYPQDFYGMVEADLGKLYAFNFDTSSKEFKLIVANDLPDTLLKK